MINVIGIGQNRENMTLGAIKAIEDSDVIIGYKKYINQIEDLIEGKEILKKGMGDEIARAEVAIQKSKEGQTVSLVSSGDPGVFGMANVLYQIISKYAKLSIGKSMLLCDGTIVLLSGFVYIALSKVQAKSFRTLYI